MRLLKTIGLGILIAIALLAAAPTAWAQRLASWDPTQHDYGDVVVGTSTTQIFTFVYDEVPFDLDEITLVTEDHPVPDPFPYTGDAFTITDAPEPQAYPVPGSFDVEVTFVPNMEGAHEVFLRFRSDDAYGNDDVRIPLFGIGTLDEHVIDFETTPAGLTPDDNAELVSTYAHGATTVAFGFDTDDDLVIDTNAHFELRGSDSVSAYNTGPNNLGPRDIDVTPTGVGGSWLLRAPGNFGDGIDIKGGDDFLVIYMGALPTSASGQIWDIDAVNETLFERWQVQALDAAGNVIATRNSPFFSSHDNPPAESLDGWPWTFSFGDLGSPIQTIHISFTGNVGPFEVGFAFDNFNASAAASDQDADGIDDNIDNCVLVANPDQRDTNGDQIGNACDADIAPALNDCIVNFGDLMTMADAFFSNPLAPHWNPDADFNGDDQINFIDLNSMADAFFDAPGPSGLPNICDGL